VQHPLGQERPRYFGASGQELVAELVAQAEDSPRQVGNANHERGGEEGPQPPSIVVDENEHDQHGHSQNEEDVQEVIVRMQTDQCPENDAPAAAPVFE